VVISCTQIIEIIDNQFPTITNVPADITITCAQDVPAVATDVIATDNCSYDTDFSEEITGTAPCDYVITRTWTAYDACNNTVTETQTITVLLQAS